MEAMPRRSNHQLEWPVSNPDVATCEISAMTFLTANAATPIIMHEITAARTARRAGVLTILIFI